ncbi:MAG: hypothetical protein AAGJ82_00205 [Bacteroidota bacterium]
MELLLELKARNALLFYFGLMHVGLAVLLISWSFTSKVELTGVNAWYKPIKFALSTVLLVWAVAWYEGYLVDGDSRLSTINWIIVLTLGFEVAYITWQAARGELSHFNSSTPFYAAMFSLMALAASVATLAIGYVGLQFWTNPLPALSPHYLWAIRCGFVLFCVFAFQGFMMGGNGAHTVGAVDGGEGLPFLNWSSQFGDLRVAHFIGMHAIQVLPLLAYYLLRDVKWTLAVATLYGVLACYVLWQALQAKPFLKFT